ncbi:hypothetical protein OQA88_10355 [Cercophora sp. LCS_1]
MPGERPTPRPGLNLADSLLYGFDVGDETSSNYLHSLVEQDCIPQQNRDELLRLSLMNGVEEWNMLFARATALRDEASRSGYPWANPETDLVAYLGQIVPGDATTGEPQLIEQQYHVDCAKERQRRRPKGTTRSGSGQRNPGKTVSHFWDTPDGTRLDSRSSGHGINCSPDPDRDQAGGSTTADWGFHVPPPLNAPFQSSLDANTHQPRPKPATDEKPTLAQFANSPPTVHPQRATKSPFFTTPPRTPKSRPRPGTVSSLPIPPLSSATFGLVQEELASSPFSLLVAVTFLIKTKATVAIPVFRQLMERFPRPAELAAADPDEIIPGISPLGLSGVRCAKIQRYARTWLTSPPSKDKRYGVKNYPKLGDGKGVRGAEEFGGEEEEDAKAVGCAWEIGHLTSGPYALDSWRIFCRDVLLGRAEDWNGRGAGEGFQPEWMRVLPKDKELRACLRWMWMREGWLWDPETGDKEIMGEEMRNAVNEGRVGYDDTGGLVILSRGTN